MPRMRRNARPHGLDNSCRKRTVILLASCGGEWAFVGLFAQSPRRDVFGHGDPSSLCRRSCGALTTQDNHVAEVARGRLPPSLRHALSRAALPSHPARFFV